MNQKYAEQPVQDFSDYIKVNGFIVHQVFNCVEPVSSGKKYQGGHTSPIRRKYHLDTNQGKDRLTIFLFGNASGDFQIKLLLVYHSEYSRVFNKYNVIKSKLPVIWWASSKALITRKCFIVWIREVFAPSVKKILARKQFSCHKIPSCSEQYLLTFMAWRTS